VVNKDYHTRMRGSAGNQ